MEDKKQGQQQIDINLDEATAEGVYSNMAIISHSTSEFVIDFIRIMPGVPKAKVKSRVVLTPEHAKRLLISIQDNVAKYESMFGEIKIPQAKDKPTMVFGGGNA